MSGTWSKDIDKYHFSTNVVHGTIQPDMTTGAILTPIYQSTTFVQDSIDEYLGKGYSYSRTGNPTVNALEEKIAFLENGAGAACFSTGMAATVSVMSAFLIKGDHCILTNVSYGGTNRVTRKMFQQYGVEFSYVDFTNPENIKNAIKENTRLVFSETPCNPTCSLADLGAISGICKDANILHCCDATFSTPVICRPLDHGCDIVVQSLTKYYCGHNMNVGGAVISKNKKLDERIHFMQNMHGNICSAQTAFQFLQTLKTMELRVKQQSRNALQIAKFLESHEKIERVGYPGLESHPQHELATKQHIDGIHGTMLWCEVKGGVESGRKLMNSIQRPWSLCENLGSVESIITCPSVMTHANVAKEERESVGITDGFIRISVGIENVNDLIETLDDALQKLDSRSGILSYLSY